MTNGMPFELTPTEDAPMNTRLTDLDQLVGQTIKAVIQYPSKRTADAVIVTTDNNWMVLLAEGGDDAVLSVVKDWTNKETTHSYCTAQELYQNGCINSGEFALLREHERKAEEEERARKVERIKKELAKLEGRDA